MARVLISVFLIFAGYSLSFPQGGSVLRIEIEAQLDEDVFHVVSCAEHGVLVFYETTAQLENGERIWLFKLYDNQLKHIRDYEIPLVNNVFYNDSEKTLTDCYLAFYNAGKIKQDEHNLHILRFNYENLNFHGIKASIEEKSSFVDMEIYGRKVFLGFNMDKFQIGIYLADFSDRFFQRLEYKNSAKEMLEDIYIDPYSTHVKALVNHFVNKKQSRLNIVAYNLNGSLKSTYYVQPNDFNIELNSARMLALGKNNELIIGTYNNAAAESSELKNEDEIISAGVYVVKTVDEQQVFIKKYNFLDFQNFYTYVNASQVFRLKKKAGKTDNRDYSLNYRLLLHDILKLDDQFILLAEAYYPDYRTVSYITYDYYGRPFPQTYTVFEGFKFFSGIITGFDSDGNLLWDNGIKVRDMVSFQLNPRISAFTDGTELVLVYSTEGKIASEIYNDGKVVGEFEYNELERKYKKDKVTADENSNLIRWYDSYFLGYGYQEIVNNGRVNDPQRTVFYINKLVFE